MEPKARYETYTDEQYKAEYGTMWETQKKHDAFHALPQEDRLSIVQSQQDELQASKTSLAKIRAYAEMEEVQKRFIRLLGDRDGRAYVESVVIAVSSNDQLQKCSPKSIMVSAMRAASLKLSVDPALHQAHLVPFGNEATLIVDYHGLVQLSVNTGYYEYAPNVSEVYEGETAKTDRFTGVVTIEGEKTSNNVIGWVGYFKAKNGVERYLYMTNEELDAHGEKYSKGYNYKKNNEYTSLWRKEPEKMRRKTVLRLLVMRWGNFSPQVQNVIKADEETIEAEAIDMPDDSNITVEEKPRRSALEAMSEMGFDNPDPIKDATWKEWGSLQARAGKNGIDTAVINKAKSTEQDLKAYMSEILTYVIDAERQAE